MVKTVIVYMTLLNWMSFAMCMLVGASDSRLQCWWVMVMIDVKTLASSQLILTTPSPIVDVLSREGGDGVWQCSTSLA